MEYSNGNTAYTQWNKQWCIYIYILISNIQGSVSLVSQSMRYSLFTKKHVRYYLWFSTPSIYFWPTNTKIIGAKIKRIFTSLSPHSNS